MKAIFSLLLAALISGPLVSQTITLRFDGSSNRDYEVRIDGKSYFSSSITPQRNTNQRVIVLDNILPGMHNLEVYASTETADNSSALYSNNFQLRDGYDMFIGIRRNGQVTFTEKRMDAASGTTLAEMPDTEFDKLILSVKNKWSQSARVTALKSAISTKANYFTTEQVGQMLALLSSERSRIDIAKLAFAKVTDPNNFSEISAFLTSQAGRTELENYIAANQRTNTTVGTNTGYSQQMTTANFNRLMQSVRNQYQQSGKVALITNAFNNTDYFSTTQVRQLVSLITAEADRLVLLKLSYPRIVDQANFSSLNTLLTRQASRDDLNYYVRTGNNAVTEDYSNRIAVTDSEYRRILQKASLHFRQSSVVKDVKDAFSTTVNWYSIAQIRGLLELISTEADRLALAKLAYHRATEPYNYSQLYDLFTLESSRNDLSNYINSVATNR